MTVTEIACDACTRTLGTVDAPVEPLAAQVGWSVTDITLCPGCAAAAVEPAASYGQHHRGDDETSAKYWTADIEFTDSYPDFPFPLRHRHRYTDDSLLDVHGLAATLDRATLARAASIRAGRRVV